MRDKDRLHSLIKDYFKVISDSVDEPRVTDILGISHQSNQAQAAQHESQEKDFNHHEKYPQKHGRIIDNSGYDRDLTHPLNRKLVASRGKNFTKEKQKNKNKLYSLSLENDQKSFKFSDSD